MKNFYSYLQLDLENRDEVLSGWLTQWEWNESTLAGRCNQGKSFLPSSNQCSERRVLLFKYNFIFCLILFSLIFETRTLDRAAFDPFHSYVNVIKYAKPTSTFWKFVFPFFAEVSNDFSFFSSFLSFPDSSLYIFNPLKKRF